MSRRRRAPHQKSQGQSGLTKTRWRLWGLVALAASAAIASWFVAGAGSVRRPTGPEVQRPAAIWNDEPLFPVVNLSATPHEMADEAQRVLDTLGAAFPDSPHALSATGHVYSLFGRSAEAMDCWQRSLALDPAFAQGYRQIGSKEMEDGKYEEAADALQTAYDLERSFPGIANQLADAMMHAGKMAEARAVLLESVRDGTNTPGVHFLLGKVFMQLQEFDQAYQYLQRAVEEDPDDANGYYRLARAAARLGLREEAAKWRHEFQSRKATATAVGVDNMRSREDSKRVRSYLATTYQEAGSVYRRHGQLQEVESHWLFAAAWSPGDVGIRQTLAIFFRDRDELVKRVKVLQQLREIEPNNATHMLELGRGFADVGRFADAEDEFKELCAAFPERSEGFSALALLYMGHAEKVGQATALVEQALRLEATAANYFLLGVAQQTAGNLPAAVEAIRRAIELEPHHAGYREAYDALKSNL